MSAQDVELADLKQKTQEVGENSIAPIGPMLKGWDYRSLGPFTVNVQFLVTDILQIDSVVGSYRMNMDLAFDWEDPAVCSLDKDDWVINTEQEIFKPEICILNALEKVEVESESIEAQKTIDTKRPCVTMATTYNMEYRAPMDLREFPFDSQMLPVSFIENRFTRDKLRFMVLQKNPSEILPPELKLPDFHFTNLEIKEEDFAAGYMSRYQEDAHFHQVTLCMHVQRKPEYYMSRIMSVILFLLCMAGGVFFLSPEDLANRLNLTLTLFLTAVAFHFVVSADLPKIPYATRLDKYLAFMYVLLFLTAIEHVISNRLTRSYTPKVIADSLDLASIIVFYVILALGSLWFVWPYFGMLGLDTPQLRMTNTKASKRDHSIKIHA